ncbi:MAG: hypothetical protein IPL77_21810 [Flavobacteriales bacterium]|nr:hypothetical protein [Flavobacteriales bacterium]
MLRTLTLVTGIGSFASFCSGQGQLTSVTFSPNNISECNLVMITINGNIPGGASPQSFGYSQVGNTITIPLLVSPGGGPASFSQPVGPFGPYAPGSYTFIIQMDVNGTIVDTETIVKVVTAGVNPDAGQFGSDTVCTSDPNFNLFTLLTGADPGGSWTDPLNQPRSDPSIRGVTGGVLHLFHRGFTTLHLCVPAGLCAVCAADERPRHVRLCQCVPGRGTHYPVLLFGRYARSRWPMVVQWAEPWATVQPAC